MNCFQKRIILLLMLFISVRGVANSLFIETELFSNKGGWIVDNQFIDQMGSPYLLAHGLGNPVHDATTKVLFQEKGKYYVWVRTKDWAPFPIGPGKFQVLINGKELKQTFGSTGIVGWHWYEGGKTEIKTDSVEIRLRDLTGFEGRCDAIYFTKSKECPPNDLNNLTAFRKSKMNISTKQEGHFDLVVAGGGSAGISAAVQAARLGLKVALVNNRPVLGGNSSSEIRVSTDGDVFRNKYPKIGQIVREIDNYEAGIGGSDKKLYKDDFRKDIVLNEKNITLFENYHLAGATADNGQITSVRLIDILTLNECILTADLFADCTGDATLGLHVGADHYYGRESKAETGEADAPEIGDNLVMGSSNQWYSKYSGEITDFPTQDWMIQFSADYHFDLTRSVWNWETGFKSFHTVKQAEEIRDHNFRAIYGNWAYLKTKKKERYGKHQLEYLAHVAGKRESYRLMGDHILTQQDVENKVEYPDAVVTATWGIDLHYPDTINAKRFPNEEFIGYAVHPSRQQDVYTLPYRCLYSRNVNNLFMAGRNISVTHIALGTVRVQRCTGMMGEVVGYAAYLCKKHGCSPREIYTSHLNEFINLLK